MESADDAIIGATLDGTITEWNRAAEVLYGYSAEEAVGQPISITVPPDRADEAAAIWERVARGERSAVRDRAADEGRAAARRRDHPLSRHGSDGHVTGMSGFVRDITERKRAEPNASVWSKRSASKPSASATSTTTRRSATTRSDRTGSSSRSTTPSWRGSGTHGTR